MIRRTLPQRRAAETFDLRFWNQLFTVTVVFYADGTPGEVFIDGCKTGNDMGRSRATPACCSASRSSTGFPLKIRHAVTRGASEEPASILGAVVHSITRNHFREASDGC